MKVQKIPAVTPESFLKYETSYYSCACGDRTGRGGSYICPIEGDNVCKHMAGFRQQALAERRQAEPAAQAQPAPADTSHIVTRPLANGLGFEVDLQATQELRSLRQRAIDLDRQAEAAGSTYQGEALGYEAIDAWMAYDVAKERLQREQELIAAAEALPADSPLAYQLVSQALHRPVFVDAFADLPALEMTAAEIEAEAAEYAALIADVADDEEPLSEAEIQSVIDSRIARRGPQIDPAARAEQIARFEQLEQDRARQALGEALDSVAGKAIAIRETLAALPTRRPVHACQLLERLQPQLEHGAPIRRGVA